MLDLKEISILVIGNIPIIRSGIVLELHKAGIRKVFEINEWLTQNSAIGDRIPDVIVVVIDRVDDQLSTYVEDLQCNFPGGRILMLCPNLNEMDVYRLMKMGVSGMVKNGEPPENLILAVQTVAVGQSWFSACFAEKFTSLSANDPETLLTSKDVDLLNSIAEGRHDREIALELNISERTVRNILQRIYTKIHVQKKLQAVLWAAKHNFIRGLN